MRKPSPSAVAIIGFALVVVLASSTFWLPTPKTTAPICGQPQVVIKCLDYSLTQYNDRWETEVSRRFSNALVIFIHGSEPIMGQWAVNTPLGHRLAADVVREYQCQFPDRTIILLACNPGHLRLGVKGVYYFKSSVWCIPDRAMDGASVAEGRMTIDGLDRLPTSRPSTQPYPFTPFDFFMPPMSVPFHAQTRWEIDPTVNGNIFEAVMDD